MDFDVDQIQSEARKTFSLRDRILGTSTRRKMVTVYTDVNAGARLGYVEEDQFGRKTRKGLIGQLDEFKADLENRLRLLADDDDEAIALLKNEFDEKTADLLSQITELREELAKTAFIFTLQSIPTVIVESMRRKAKKALDIKGKNIPEDREDEFAVEYACQFLAASVASWKDAESGETYDSLTVEQAHELRDYLPAGQWFTLDQAIAELSIEKAIGNAGTDDVDF